MTRIRRPRKRFFENDDRVVVSGLKVAVLVAKTFPWVYIAHEELVLSQIHRAVQSNFAGLILNEKAYQTESNQYSRQGNQKRHVQSRHLGGLIII